MIKDLIICCVIAAILSIFAGALLAYIFDDLPMIIKAIVGLTIGWTSPSIYYMFKGD